MKKLWLLAFVPLLLAGCGDQKTLENLVKEQLKDPESVMFKEFTISEKKTQACLVFNAKNGFGGYGAWNVAEFVKYGDKWRISTLDGREENCTAPGFKALDTAQPIFLETMQELIPIVAKLNESSEADAEILLKQRDCVLLVADYRRVKKSISQHRANGTDFMVDIEEKFLQNLLHKFSTKNLCKSQ